MNSQQELLEAINTISQNRDRSFDTPATVLRVEGDTVWVHIDGGADETPVNKTISCAEGETVQVRISNGSAFLVGNASAPPTDDKTANVAHFVAEQADVKAVKAEETATEAQATADTAQATAQAAQAAVAQSLTTYETYYLLSATTPTQPTESSHSGWSTTEPAWSSSSTDNLYFSVRTVKGDGTATWSAVGMVQSYADLQILKNAIISTVASDYVAQGSSNVTSLSSTMIQNVNGVNIFNNTLAVGDSYAHIDNDSFDIKKCTTAGAIDDANDTMLASFGREVTVGNRNAGVFGDYSQVYGIACVASGKFSHAEGRGAAAGGDYSHAEGQDTIAGGDYSHAEGHGSTASKDYSHAEGGATEASGDYSHAEGYATKASGNWGSHTEGNATKASGDASHAEGGAAEASGNYSHAEGYETEASGNYSHAQNFKTIAASNYQTVIGKYNRSDSNNIYALIVGNGNEIFRSNALRVDWSGNVQIGGTLQDLNGVSLLDEWTATATVSSGSITFSNLDDSLDYSKPFFENGLYNVTAMTKSGSGTSTSLTFTTDAPDNTVGKLRIIR